MRDVTMAYILGLVRRLALFGVITLMVCVFAFGTSITSIYQVAFAPSTFIEWFYAYIFFAAIAFPILEIISVIFWKIKDGDTSIIGEFFEGLWLDISYPFINIGAFFQAVFDRGFISTVFGWITVIFEFLWVIVWTAFIALGLLSTAGVIGI